MVPKKIIQDIVAQFKSALDDDSFYLGVYSYLIKQQKQHVKKKDKLAWILLQEYGDLSRHLDNTGIQDSCVVRNNIRICRLVPLLIDSKGNLKEEALARAIKILEEHNYCLGPSRQYDGCRREHMLAVLKALQQSQELQKALKKINKPSINKRAEEFIRETLRLGNHVTLTNGHARQATLAAWLTFLRQNVGSCFATAPAIMILHEQPDKFLDDIRHLIAEGRLKRTFGGVEYAVPLSSSWGQGDLKRPFVVYRDDTNVWMAPGIISAFEAAGIIDHDSEHSEKVEMIKALFLQSFNKFYPGLKGFITNASLLLRQSLLIYNNITEDDLEEYQNKKSSMMGRGMMLGAPPSKSGSKNPCEAFENQYKAASGIFKAFTDNALLKSWEFSLASFSETKADFAQWNLYTSLGLNPQEPHGIGFAIYTVVKQRLDEYNKLIGEYQEMYEQKYTEVKYNESRLSTASSEQDLQWLKMEYKHRAAEMDEILYQRNATHAKAQRIAGLFQFLIDYYEDKFKDYFQEVYDADMHDFVGNEYDDAPAGFRLLYKHGRANTSLWTMIYHPREFIDYLADFFMSTEREMAMAPELKDLEEDFSCCVTEVVKMIKTKEFLEASLFRMAAAYNVPIPKDPLEHLEHVEKKPWVYVSGGTMGNLVSCYYYREQKPTEEATPPVNPRELLAFFIKVMRSMSDTSMFIKEPKKRLLIHSPTHAFTFMPGQHPLCEAWQSKEDIHSWIVENVIIPGQRSVSNINLDKHEMVCLIDFLAEKLPSFLRDHFKNVFSSFPSSMSPPDFRSFMIEKMQAEPSLQVEKQLVLPVEEIDSTLFSSLPFSNTNYLRENIQLIQENIPEGYNIPNLLEVYELLGEDVHKHHVISAKQLREICLSLMILSLGQVTASQDYYEAITEAMRASSLALPKPIIFADTNWIKDYFGFVVNPGTETLDLWRLDYIGSQGMPMSTWKKWLDENTHDKRYWGIYINHNEFR